MRYWPRRLVMHRAMLKNTAVFFLFGTSFPFAIGVGLSKILNINVWNYKHQITLICFIDGFRPGFLNQVTVRLQWRLLPPLFFAPTTARRYKRPSWPWHQLASATSKERRERERNGDSNSRNGPHQSNELALPPPAIMPFNFVSSFPRSPQMAQQPQM
jgi:hypothetical protein